MLSLKNQKQKNTKKTPDLFYVKIHIKEINPVFHFVGRAWRMLILPG